MEVRFGEDVTLINNKYLGLEDPIEHMNHCRTVFAKYPQQEWVHHFVHTLEMTPNASMELREGTQDWEGLAKKFSHTFEFTNEHPIVDDAL